jgi:glycosyltransferase involved in cell wall biosynthesis
MDLTVVVLTKNEEVNLPRCIQSLSDIPDVVVVDSGSTDATLSIARAHNARVFVHEQFPFVIAEQRNWVLDNVSDLRTWVLFLDADEALTPALLAALSKEIGNSRPNVSGYRLCPKFMFLGKWLRHAAQYPSWHDRLVRLGQNRYVGGVWERFENKDGILQISEPYLHYALNSGVSNWIERHNRYSSHFADEWEKNYVNSKISIGSLLFGHSQVQRETIRQIAFQFPELLPAFRVFHASILRKGLLDGFPGALYSVMLGYYEFMTYLKILEKRRRNRGLPF